MSRRRSARRSRTGSRFGTALLAIVVVLLGGAVLNSGGGGAVVWAVGVALVATAAHLLVGKRTHRTRRRRR